MTNAGQTVRLLAAGGMLLAGGGLLRARLHRRIDGWRRASGLVLGDEASTFVLSAFGLDPWSDSPEAERPSRARTESHVAARLRRFLDGRPECRVGLRRSVAVSFPVPTPAASFTLAFEDAAEGPARFVMPRAWRGEHQDAQLSPLLNLVCRIAPDGAVDLWMRVNHAGADGVPMQELLTRLEAEWGRAGDVRFPGAGALPADSAIRPLPGRPGFSEVQTFLDFSPLLAWRKRINARLPEPMTVTAAMLWHLARHTSLAGRRFGTTVEVAPAHGLPRGVGVVVIRPTDYAALPDGLARYTADFNRAMERTRRRESPSCRTLDAAALLPAGLARTLLIHALDNDPRAFGTVGLTMLKDAQVFGAPLAAAGHADGFIAIGSLGLPAADGTSVGSVSVKGPTAVVATYPDRLRDVLRGCATASER